MLTDEAMRERMANGWTSGLADGTPCGRGSTIASTRQIRGWLPDLVQRHACQVVCDAGAGDLHWIERVQWSVTYLPFDLVPRHESVRPIDITTDRLPACDLILCRFVLNHLDRPRVRRALDRFADSGRLLLATQFPGGGKDYPDFTAYDLREFDLGEPLELLPDTDGWAGLWRL